MVKVARNMIHKKLDIYLKKSKADRKITNKVLLNVGALDMTAFKNMT